MHNSGNKLISKNKQLSSDFGGKHENVDDHEFFSNTAKSYKMNTKQKKALYESIMKNVSKTVKKQLNESETVDEYKTRMNNYINNWFETAFHTGDENLDNKIKSQILECAAKFNPHIKDYIDSDDYKDRSYRARVKVLKPHFDSLDIQTKIRIINMASLKTLLGYYYGK